MGYFDSDGYVCHLGCSGSFTGIYRSKVVLLYALNMCSLLYDNHTSKSCLKIKMSLSLLVRLYASPRSHWAPTLGNVPDASYLPSKSILCFHPSLHPGKLTCGDQIKRPLCPLARHWVQPWGWQEIGGKKEMSGRLGLPGSLVQAILKATFSTWMTLSVVLLSSLPFPSFSSRGSNSSTIPRVP